MEHQPHQTTPEKLSLQGTALGLTPSPPRHWIDLEELDPSYWGDASTREKRGQEFFEKPVETIDLIDRSSKSGLARRDFLTIMGASMAMASFACARRPVHKIIPYVVKPEEVMLGVSNWYASTDPETGSGLLIRTREARPIKLEGNPSHPINRGAISARTQTQILSLYDPDRLTTPVSYARGGGARKELSWTDVDAAIAPQLAKATRVRVLSGPIHSDSTRRLVRDFLSGFRSGELVEWQPHALDELAEAQALCYGTAIIPHYRFDQAQVVLSLGADYLGTWNSPTEHAQDWVKNRKVSAEGAKETQLSKLYCFEPTMTITGAKSDERFPIRAGDEIKIALAIASELAAKGAPGLGGISVLSGYKADAVAADTGVPVEKIRQVANDLWKARGKGLVVAGGPQSQTKDALALQIAVNLLNSALDNDGTTVAGSGLTAEARGGFAAVLKLVEEMKAGQVDVLVVYRSNPAYMLPAKAMGVANWEDAFKKVPMVVAITDREDETAKLADFALPDHHFLENWGDSSHRKGIYGLQQPAIQPIHATRSFQDSLLAWVRSLGGQGSLAARVAHGEAGKNDWHEFLMANWRETVYPIFGPVVGSGTFEKFWENTLREGLIATASAKSPARVAARSFHSGALSQLPKFAPAGDGIVLSLYTKVTMGDGRHANNPWLQELPDPISSITWDNYLNIGPATAKRLNLNNDDVCEITVGDVKAELPVKVQPGMHPQAVSAALGYGRRSVGKVGDGAGVDLSPFIKVEGGHAVYSGQPVTLRKTGRFYKLALTQWHFATENRPIINDVTLAQFKENPDSLSDTDPEIKMHTVPSIWPSHEYKGYRWGMAIDLNSCIACQACVAGCQAENNIPVVGRDQVRVARQMHWIRIDRYYSGTPENPDVTFQPMLCQHCENAPCETVCPVLATVHDDEGVNQQTYNRCVGTRYCSNNCPYKVRRFNFFDHWKSYEGTMNLAWNPDVTVRTRGIMEKCSFCVQRVMAAKDLAKDEDRKVRDGDVVTACQQTCPTGAIVFGNINDPASRVSKLKNSGHAFRVLEVLNTKPAVSYMTVVRNVERPRARADEAGEHDKLKREAPAKEGEHHG